MNETTTRERWLTGLLLAVTVAVIFGAAFLITTIPPRDPSAPTTSTTRDDGPMIVPKAVYPLPGGIPMGGGMVLVP